MKRRDDVATTDTNSLSSLCIIQDSTSDWANEAGKMVNIYGHADCTIAYLLPPADVHTRPRRGPRIWSPCALRRPSDGVKAAYIYTDQTRWYDKDVQDWLSLSNWPLFGRAWTCQEWLLSPRIVFVGHRNLMWECSELRCDELLGPFETFPGATASKSHFAIVRAGVPSEATVAVRLTLWSTGRCSSRTIGLEP